MDTSFTRTNYEARGYPLLALSYIVIQGQGNKSVVWQQSGQSLVNRTLRRLAENANVFFVFAINCYNVTPNELCSRRRHHNVLSFCVRIKDSLFT